MYIQDDGIRLNAQLDLPEKMGEKCPIAVILHGYTGNMEEPHIMAVARTFNELGFAALRADLYGHGKSDGQFKDHTLYKWLTNAMTLIDYARNLDFVSDVYLCGHSQGGLTVMLAAALKRDVIRAVVPLSPACMIPEGARKGELLGLSFDPEHIPDVMTSVDGVVLGGNYARVAQTIHVEEAIRKYHGPVLIIHGDEDETVPVRYAVEAAEAYAHAKLVIIPGDTHCYDHHLHKVTDAIREWVMAGLR